MILENVVVGIYQTNCYIIACQETGNGAVGAVIDPGDQGDLIIQKIKDLGLNIKYIILTHGHLDHIGAVRELKEYTGADILIHEKDAEMLTDCSKNLSVYSENRVIQPKADRFLNDGDKIRVGNLTLTVIHTPGHTPGSISLKTDKYLFTGDTLFSGSIGRTDLPGGSYQQIIKSINEKLMLLSGDLLVLPGHGPETTLNREKVINPFLK
ncbi:MAG: hydroxyacylglutathione hydrolase [Thermosediminibacterales bacterium]|jgi:glyoxylase-like metal-dependent hydrolase (beta-lactamase superfamily II)|nr:hydroxyacylglutathione hydrolase [Thermosediminibacterales bacterium]